MLMTTLLLGFYLIYRLKWNRIMVTAVLLVWAFIEISFFITNVVKIQDRWMYSFFELVLFAVMYVWYEARKTNNRFIKFVDIGKYANLISDLRQDTHIPKFSTHLIYLTKANTRNEIEEKIMNSIFSKKPKRADVYWFLHINRTDDPYTLNYEVTELIEETVIKVTINIGFRIQPRTEYYFKKIVGENGVASGTEYGRIARCIDEIQQ